MQDVNAVPAPGTPPRHPGPRQRPDAGRRKVLETTEERTEKRPLEEPDEQAPRLDLTV